LNKKQHFKEKILFVKVYILITMMVEKRATKAAEAALREVAPLQRLPLQPKQYTPGRFPVKNWQTLSSPEAHPRTTRCFSSVLAVRRSVLKHANRKMTDI